MTLSLLLALAAQAAPAPPPRPKLVVMITVDQLRPDYLDRYRSQLTGGLALLRREGAVFTAAYQDHAVTETAPGHATVLSGRWPAHTGIVSNVLGVLDDGAPLLEVAGLGASPVRFRGTAFFDWLKASHPGARALSVSRKDRGAILPMGRAREHVYWYQSGLFTTSRYYADTLPQWVRAFNAKRIPFKAAGTEWRLLLPDSAYSEPDDEPWENGGRAATFPYRLPDDSAQAAALFAGVPAMDSLTLAFALAGARALGLGARGSIDLLAVSLSTTDAVGHAFGPDSREIHDQVLRLDRYLGWFLAALVQRYGRQNLLIALTADHGVTPFPDRSRTQGHPDATNVEPVGVLHAINAELAQRVGSGAGDWLSFDTGMFILGAGGRESLVAAGVGIDSLVGVLADRVRALPGVARVDRPADLAGVDTVADPGGRRWLHHLPPDAGVVLVATLEPYSVWGGALIAEHGQPSDLDAQVPFILWGGGGRIRRGVYRARANTVDIAPTLARLLRVRPLEQLDGRVLVEALTQR